MRKKIVGILCCMLVLATALPAVSIMTDKDISNGYRGNDKPSNDILIPKNLIDNNYGGIFIQFPDLPNSTNFFEWSSEPNRQIFENFNEISNPICDVHWWGEYNRFSGGQWIWLDPNLMRVNISFYENDNGQPGALVESYIDVKPSVNPTGLWYDFGDPVLAQLYYFQYDLDPCVNILDGWVSISSVANADDGWLLWMTSPDGNHKFLRYESGSYISYFYDVALALTDGESDEPDLECEGTLNWDKVKPGSKVNGSFQVKNNGGVNSILHWKIDETTIPDWGTNWTFMPNASILTTDMGWLNVDIEFESPPEKNKKFTGKIKVVNILNSSDYHEIDITCKNPKDMGIFNPLLMRILNLFQLLKRIVNLQ
jgi:hypothetical protein